METNTPALRFGLFRFSRPEKITESEEQSATAEFANHIFAQFEEISLQLTESLLLPTLLLLRFIVQRLHSKTSLLPQRFLKLELK